MDTATITGSAQREAVKRLRDEHARLIKALAPFALDRRSDEYAASCGMAYSRAAELRMEAAMIERRDAEIQEARDALSAVKGHENKGW